MKAFLASLLVASATLASNTVTWTGTKATGGDISAIPKGSSSWSGTADEMVVTWKTSVSLSEEMANYDFVQAWWCMPSSSRLDCNLWQWRMEKGDYVIKGRNYEKAFQIIDTTIPAT